MPPQPGTKRRSRDDWPTPPPIAPQADEEAAHTNDMPKAEATRRHRPRRRDGRRVASSGTSSARRRRGNPRRRSLRVVSWTTSPVAASTETSVAARVAAARTCGTARTFCPPCTAPTARTSSTGQADPRGRDTGPAERPARTPPRHGPRPRRSAASTRPSSAAHRDPAAFSRRRTRRRAVLELRDPHVLGVPAPHALPRLGRGQLARSPASAAFEPASPLR